MLSVNRSDTTVSESGVITLIFRVYFHTGLSKGLNKSNLSKVWNQDKELSFFKRKKLTREF
jgi:hypothetical protein